MSKQPKDQLEPANRDLEIALVKIARTLFDYTESQENFQELSRLDPIFDHFEQTANNYHNHTGRLHPDLGFELAEWTAFKRELLAPNHAERVKEGKSGLTRKFVDAYGKVPRNIIRLLEHDLGIDG
jgi:hypothetical protein